MYSSSCVLWAFFVFSASFFVRQTAIFLIIEAEMPQKTHPKSSHDKFTTVSQLKRLCRLWVL